MKLIYGWGVNDADYVVQPTVDGKRVWCLYYTTWKSMLMRCYYPKYQLKRPTYIGCRVDERWRSFKAFRSWMERQDWVDKHLDKDFLATESPGKLYSPDTCCFIPQWLNKLFTDRGAARGEWPQGVSWHKVAQRFQAHLNVDGHRQHLGLFDTPEAAFNAYVDAKTKYVEDKLQEHPQPVPIESGIRRQLGRLLAQTCISTEAKRGA